MRTLNRSIRLLTLGLGALGASLLALAACSDSLHLDPAPAPPGGTGGGSTGPGGGGGGAAPIPCESNSDCVFRTSVCDTDKGVCVECLTHEDCSFEPGTICSEGACACPEATDSFCPTVGTTGEPGFQAARCVDLATSPEDCGTCGHACFGACNAGQCADAWEPTAMVDAPAARAHHVAVWTGDRMIVWGGEVAGSALTNTGGMYDPATRAWTPTSTANAPKPRRWATAVWTGTHMIVWGGNDGTAIADGGIFDPATNTWKEVPPPTSAGATLGSRYLHTAVWADGQMIVWGGADNLDANRGEGAAFNPETGAWTDLPPAPYQRRQHTAIWADSAKRMVVFGGFGYDATTGLDNQPLNTIGVYNPAMQAWDNVAPPNPPMPRYDHTAVWTGSAMLVWGGFDTAARGDGAQYNVLGAGWLAMLSPFPAARRLHTAVWIGGTVERMIIWGGHDGGYLDNGGLYDPVTNSWRLDMPRGPSARAHHTAVVTDDDRMIIWGGSGPGGQSPNSVLRTGAIFDPARLTASQ